MSDKFYNSVLQTNYRFCYTLILLFTVVIFKISNMYSFLGAQNDFVEASFNATKSPSLTLTVLVCGLACYLTIIYMISINHYILLRI